MPHDDSYLNARLAERRRQVRSGMAGIGLLLALGWGLLWTYPAAAHAATNARAASASAVRLTPGLNNWLPMPKPVAPA
jgi:hypothetical protein